MASTFRRQARVWGRRSPKAVKGDRRETSWFSRENDVTVWDPESGPARSTSLISLDLPGL